MCALIGLTGWLTALFGLVLAVTAILLAIWWRQQSIRWPIVVALCLVAAIALSWWSGMAFQVPDYRAGCDGLCPGYRGAPVRIYQGEAAGRQFMPGMFAVNCLVYFDLLLSWGAVMRAVVRRIGSNSRNQLGWQLLVGLVMLLLPFALEPLYLPPPEAHVRGNPQRIAINAQRELYLYDRQATVPVMRAALEDVRPRSDGQPGMRVCFRTYTYFYLPLGHLYLDMTPEGVHSNAGGVLPRQRTCWEPGV